MLFSVSLLGVQDRISRGMKVSCLHQQGKNYSRPWVSRQHRFLIESFYGSKPCRNITWAIQKPSRELTRRWKSILDWHWQEMAIAGLGFRIASILVNWLWRN